MRDTKEKFSSRTVMLHWVVALIFIILLFVGLYMADLADSPDKFKLYRMHKSFGIIIFPIALWRIVWRMRNGFPEPAGDYSMVEHVLAKLVHYVLILGTVLMPISGMMMSGLGGYGIPLFGLDLVGANFVDGEAVAINGSMAGLGKRVHNIAGKAIVVALALHVLGALKHQIMDKDGTLSRMLGRRI